MEVDALKDWNSKGKSKSKDDGGKYGKGGKAKDGKTRFEGTCNLCGKTGHKKEGCWHKKTGEKGKSDKGNGKGNQDHKGKGKTSDVECYKFGKKGHFAKVCWSKPKQVAELSEKQKNIEAIEIENDDWLALDAEQCDDLREMCTVTNYEHGDTQADILIVDLDRFGH